MGKAKAPTLWHGTTGAAGHVVYAFSHTACEFYQPFVKVMQHLLSNKLLYERQDELYNAMWVECAHFNINYYLNVVHK